MNAKIFRKFGKAIALGGGIAVLSIGMFASVANATVSSVTVDVPNGGQAWNSTQNIKWICADDDSGVSCAGTTISNILYSPNGGAIGSWESTGYIADSFQGNQGNPGFSWDTTGNTPSLDGRIKVVINTSTGTDSDVSDASFIMDNTPPTILSATTNDSDGNGKIDELVVVFDESMNSAITSTTGITYALNTIGSTGTWSTTTNTNDTLTIPVTEDLDPCSYSDQSGCNTTDTSDVAYDGTGTLTDLATNALNNYGPTPVIDGAKPAMVGAKTDDSNSNGQIDTIYVQFSEDLLGTTVTDADFNVTGYTVTNATEFPDGFVTLTLTESGTPDTDAIPNVTISSGGMIKDNPAGNELQSGNPGSTITPTDGADPVAIKTAYTTNYVYHPNSASVDRFYVTFSEPVSFSGTASGFVSGLTITTNDLTGFSTPTALSTGPATTIMFTTSGKTTDLTGVNGGTEPELTYANDGTNQYVDASGNAWQSMAITSMEDKASPAVINDLTRSVPTGSTANTLELQFSEDVVDSDFVTSGGIGGWEMSSDGGTNFDTFSIFNTTTTLGGGAGITNDDYVYIGIDPLVNVIGTGVMKYRYTNNGHNITDTVGNILQNFGATTAVDGTEPVVTTDRLITNDNTPKLTGTITEAPTTSINVTVDGNTYSATNNADGTWTLPDNTIATLGDGNYTVLVTATDPAGNTGSDTATDILTIDTALPIITDFNKPTADTVYRTNALLSFTPDGTGTAASCSYSLDSGTTNNNVPCISGNAIIDSPVTGLVEGRNSIEVTVTDAAGNSVTSAPVSFVYDTDGILTVDDSPSTFPDFPTIQGAIDAAVTGIDTIEVKDGSYPENVTVDKKLTVISENGAGSTTINPTGGIPVSITSSDVTLDGFTITNPNGNKGVYIAGSAWSSVINPYNPSTPYHQMNIVVQNNILTNIGTGSGVTGNIHAIIWQDDNSYSGIVYYLKIRDNNISNIGSGTAGSTAGIAILDSTGDQQLIGLKIEDNTIENINADPTAKGAYGILINHANSYPAGSVWPTIKGNTISNLEGLWVHAIGLEGTTFSAVVTDNIISDLTDYKTPSDATAIYLEDNRGLGGNTRINNNQFNAGVANGVILNPDTTGNMNSTSGNILDATGNWWGDATGPHNANANPAGAGTEVWPAVADGQANSIDFSPFCQDQACTTLVSVDPIASFDVTFSPSFPIVGGISTLTITGKDAGGYTVVNDSSTSVNLNVSSGTATLTDSPIEMEADGDTTTTITSNTIGAATVFAADSDNYSANGYGTITFTAGADVTAPVITNIQVTSIGTSTATITWDTDEWATSQVQYGTTSGYGTLTAVDSTMNINHTVILTGLSSGTDYHFRVISLDSNSNGKTSGDNTFTTVGVDNTPPVITLLGDNPLTLNIGDIYTDSGATANDNIDGDITLNITVTGTSTVDTAIAGTYIVNYDVSDTSGNSAVTTPRTVIVVDPAVAPVIPTVTLNGDAIVSSYTVSEATTRFASGLQFDITDAASVTVNGSSVAPASTITAATLVDATALGLHVYNVVATSSTGDTANITVSYEVTADFDDTASLAVTGIDVVANENGSVGYAIANDDFADGWRWIYYVTVPTDETEFQMKFSDFISGINTIAAADNLRFYSEQSSDSNSISTATTITAADTYSSVILLDQDLETSTPGRQIEVIVEMKVPSGSAGGSYSAQYGVKSEVPTP